MRDPENTFLVLFNLKITNKSNTQLFRIDDGAPFLVNETEDEPSFYKENFWNRVRIEVHRGRIKIAVKSTEEGGEWMPIIE